jgi:tape measure domain-containing protein
MPRKIDTGFIEFLPDLSSFERVLDRDLGRILRETERTAEHSTQNIEGSFLELEQEISDTFNDIAISGTIDMERLVAVAERVATEIGGDFQHGNEVAEASFTELRRSAEVDMARLDTASAVAAGGIGKKFSGAALASTAALGGIAIAATAGLGAIATMGLTSAAQLEQVQISFNALLGSAEKGEEVFRSLQRFAALTPFEFPEVASAAKRFLAFNQQVGLSDDSLQSFLTTVGDLSSVTGAGAEGLNRITLAIGQIAGKGKVQLEELMQIGEAVPGFSAVAAIAEQLGITSQEAMAKISAGELDATTGINALLAGMQKFPGAAGAMEKQSQTLLGVFSTFKDTVGQALADSFAPAIPGIKETLTQITPIIGDALRTLAPALGSVVQGLLGLLGPLVQAITPILTPILQALGPALAELGPELVPLGEALGELAVALVPLIPLVTEFAIVLIQLLIPFVKTTAGTLQVLTPVINFMTEAIKEFGKWIKSINWGKVGDDIAGGFKKGWEATKNFFVGIGHWFSTLPGMLSDFIESIPDRVAAVFRNMATAVLQSIGIWIGLTIAAVTRLPGLIVSNLKAGGQMILDFFNGLWDDAKTGTTNRLQQMLDFVGSIPEKIAAGWEILKTLVPQILHDAFERAKQNVSNAIDGVVGFVTGLPARLGGFAAEVGNGIVGFIKRSLNSAISKVNEGIASVDAVLPGPDLPRIPLLAKGGVAFGPSVIGEAGAEAAIPLTNPRALAMLRDALGGVGSFGPGSVIINVNVNGDVSAQKAQQIGTQVAAGFQSAMQEKNITTGVRRA